MFLIVLMILLGILIGFNVFVVVVVVNCIFGISEFFLCCIVEIRGKVNLLFKIKF